MHNHIYSLFVTVDKILPEFGTPKAYFKCVCGSELTIDEGLAIINAAQPTLAGGRLELVRVYDESEVEEVAVGEYRVKSAAAKA